MLELILVLPLLIVLACGVLEFAMLLMASQAVHAAASVGAREASLPGASQTSVNKAVQRAVRDWNFSPFLQEIDIRINGTPTQDIPLVYAVTGDSISVTVSVPATAAVPDLLKYIGLSISSQNLRGTYVARRE